MRVLHVNSGNLYGGVEAVFHTLATSRHLAPHLQPEFAICFPGRQMDELRASGAPTHDLGPVRWSRPWTLWRARQRFKKLLKANRCDAVILHQPWVVAGFGPVANRLGVMVVAHMHNPPGTDPFVSRAAKVNARLVLAPSRHTLDSWKDHFDTRHRSAFNNPFSTKLSSLPTLSDERRAALRNELGAKPDDVVVLQASRVEEWKGPDNVVEALGLLRDVPHWRFAFAGAPQRPKEEELFQRMKDLARRDGIADRVTFLGQRNDVPDLMRAVDVYSQGNRGPEGFSISFLEASYFRLPIVTTDIGGAGEMVDETTGILTPVNDLHALSNGLRTLITDAALRQRMGEAAHAKAVRLCEPGKQLNYLHSLIEAARTP